MKIFITEKAGITNGLIGFNQNNKTFSGKGLIKNAVNKNGVTYGNLNGEEVMIFTAAGHLLKLKQAWDILGISREEYYEKRKLDNTNFYFDLQTDYQDLLEPIKGQKHLHNFKNALKQVNGDVEFICATDPDDEGAQIYYSILRFLGKDPNANYSYNIDTAAVDEASLIHAYQHKTLFNNRTNESLRARIRSMYDATLGWNTTTVLHSQIGRLKGALLSVVGANEDARRNYIPIFTYQVKFNYSGVEFSSNYQFENKKDAEVFAQKIINGEITFSPKTEIKKKEKIPAPLHTGTTIQRAIASEIDGGVKALNQAGNNLRLTHALITYFRTPDTHLKATNAPTIPGKLKSKSEYFNNKIDIQEYSRIGNVPSKYTTSANLDHEGIHITDNIPNDAILTANEKIVYEEVYRRTMALTMPNILYTNYYTLLTPSVDLEEAKGYSFSENTLTDIGWGAVYKRGIISYIDNPTAISADTPANINVVEIEHKPAGHYNFASLSAKMENIASDIEDKELKKIYKDVKGIGQQSTVANTIQELIDNGTFEVEGKNQKITISEDALNLFYFLRNHNISIIDLRQSALMEKSLNEIRDGNLDATDFLNTVNQQVAEITDKILVNINLLPKFGSKVERLGLICPHCKTEEMSKKTTGEHIFISCNNEDCVSFYGKLGKVKFNSKTIKSLIETGTANQKNIGSIKLSINEDNLPKSKVIFSSEILEGAKCPICSGNLFALNVKGNKIVTCENTKLPENPCTFNIFAQIGYKGGRKLSTEEIKDLIENEKVLIKDIPGKNNNTFDTEVEIIQDEKGKYNFNMIFQERVIFENSKKTGFVYKVNDKQSLWINKTLKVSSMEVVIDIQQAQELIEKGSVVVNGVSIKYDSNAQVLTDGLNFIKVTV